MAVDPLGTDARDVIPVKPVPKTFCHLGRTIHKVIHLHSGQPNGLPP